MMKPKTCSLLMLCLAVAPTAVAAQDERAYEVQHRSDCRLAAQVLTASNPHPRQEWAQNIIGSCTPHVAVPALVAWWEAHSSDMDELSRLHMASREFRDRRIYAVARSVAEDESRSPLSRIAALGVLAAYVDERINLILRFLEPVKGLRGGWSSVWVWDNHSTQAPGEQPLPMDATTEIVTLAHTLRRSQEDQVRETARHLTYFPMFTER